MSKHGTTQDVTAEVQVRDRQTKESGANTWAFHRLCGYMELELWLNHILSLYISDAAIYWGDNDEGKDKVGWSG